MVQEGELAIGDTSWQAVDTIASGDSLMQQPEPVYAILLTPPDPIPSASLRQNDSPGISGILCGLFILFLIIALRFRNNFKYVSAIFHSLVEIRTRQNVFDDTVRESSLIVLLNILWCICVGIVGFCIFQYFNPDVKPWQNRSIGMLWGMAMALAYTIFMWLAYSIIGWIFSDLSHSRLWTKGFLASQALMSPAFFITSIVCICRPGATLDMGIASAVIFIIGKLIFIWKGYRIFFSQISSWVLFLCYLCSLEIVPLILSYRSALLLSEVM